MSGHETVLFDLDGTLIDSIELILRSFRHTIATHGKHELTESEYRQSLGRPLHVQFASVADDEAELHAMVKTYRAWNAEHHDALVRPYDGVFEALQQLKADGRVLGVVTSKAHAAAQRGLDLAGIADAFDVLIGSDDCDTHKPHPGPIQSALAQLAVAPDSAAYVGDSPHDMLAGRRAGVRTVAALWGPFERAELEPSAPDMWFEDTAQLATL